MFRPKTTAAALALLAGACGVPAVPKPEPERDARAPTTAVEARATPTPILAADGSFATTLRHGDRTLLLNGSGLCEWGFLGIDLYTAALYSERRCVDLADALEPEQTMVFHLHFARGLTAEQLAAAFTAATKANAGERFVDFEDGLARLVAAMRDVARGDSYTFGCEPGHGVAIARNGTFVDRIGDEEFRRLFVRLYLGERPPTEALRDGLLGRRGG